MSDNREKDINDIIAEAMNKKSQLRRQSEDAAADMTDKKLSSAYSSDSAERAGREVPPVHSEEKPGREVPHVHDEERSGREEHYHSEHHSGDNKGGKKKKKWSTKKKVLVVILIILLVLLLVAGGIFLYLMLKLDKVNSVPREHDNSIYESIVTLPPEEENPNSEPDSPSSQIDDLQSQIDDIVAGATPIKFSDDVYNILLIGTDARTHDYRGRSDSMILVSINKKTQQLVMTSIMRDIYISIPGIGYSRLNHSYSWGGADLLIQTLQENFRIRIDKFVQVDFQSFESVIDSVGGVNIYINEDEMAIMKNYLGDQAHGAGVYRLNGKQALGYARIRYIGNADFERTQRQRTVLQELLKSAQALSPVEMNDMLDTILPMLTTDLTKGEMLDLIFHAASYLKYERVEQRVPYDNMWWSLRVDGMAVLGIDFDATISKMIDVIYGDAA